jgi:Zn-dependent protease with chaperone function
MSPALLALGYAIAAAWCLPAPLARLTARGVSARLGLAAWLTAMASVLAALAVALQQLTSAAVAGWSRLAQAVCQSVAGSTCTPTEYRSAIFELGLAVVTAAAALASAVGAWRYGRGVQRSRRRAQAHGEVARVAGHGLSDHGLADQGLAGRVLAGHGQVTVIDAPRPAAYCVPGRPGTIVLTSAALAVLDQAQLTAVLAHERAHLAGRHHLLTTLSRCLGVSFPAVPLFSLGAEEVGRLAEMCADDTAARLSDRRTVVAALLAMGTGTAVPAVPAVALGATGGPVVVRVQRLLEPPRRVSRAWHRIALTAVILLLSLGPALATPGPAGLLAGVLTGHGAGLG